MKNKAFSRYYLLAGLGVLLLSAYPLYMGVRVIGDMIRFGAVSQADYPKYIIPYTPISLAVLAGVLLMPLLQRYTKKFALPVASVIGVTVFFAAELLFEDMVIIADSVRTSLESWQMYMCYISPEWTVTRVWRAVDVLIGDYSPAFKLHFYMIALVLILSILNCLYGFGQMLLSGDGRRRKSLILQSVSAAAFLGLCIFACFTAFYRKGELMVAPISAILMWSFFLLLGITVGVYVGSLLIGRKRGLMIGLSTAAASCVTLLMYVGEMILLSGHVYRFGTGFLFRPLSPLALAPIDLIIILGAGGITAGILAAISRRKQS